MGKENDAILSYLGDRERFAELFNRFYFEGCEIVRAQDISEASEVYHFQTGKREGRGGQRIRDIKRHLKSGVCLKILALEAQNDISYIMPWRIMEYDCLEYGNQIRNVQRENQRQEEEGRWKVYQNAGERFGKFCRGDRIAPVYTICLYHGMEEWDGPRSLKDMMDFGWEGSLEEREKWERSFADYPMRLICASDFVNGSDFKTSVGAVFALLPFRKDKKGLREILEKNPEYREMDEETAQTISVLMGIRFMDKKEKYEEGKGYNMCQAIQEMVEEGRYEGKQEGKQEGRLLGRQEGKEEGIRILVGVSRDYGMKEEEIADNLQKYYALSKDMAWMVLKKY